MQIRSTTVQFVKLVDNPSVWLNKTTGTGQRGEVVFHFTFILGSVLHEYFEWQLVVVFNVIYLIVVIQASYAQLHLIVLQMFSLRSVILIHYAINFYL